MPITRRTAIQTLAGAGAAAVLPKPAFARAAKQPSAEAVAMLYDPVRCIGCKECIQGCAAANGCDPDIATLPDPQLTPLSLTVLKSYEASGTQTFCKVQCMHCVDPACVSACMLGAMQKHADGSVTWNGDLCVGCRYCQIGCPFNVPRFEWDTPLPSLTKCELCPERRAQGLQPACVESCLRGALVFGTREEMLKEARARIDARPDRYSDRIYGETEGGGTSVLYLAKAGVSFSQMGLPALSPVSVPSLPETLQHTLYKGFAAPLALFAVFAAVVRRNTQRASRIEKEEAAVHEHEHSEPVGGRLLTWPFAILSVLALIGLFTIVWRFVAGLGATTNLNDGYAMGLWIAFDVVTGTALACGGYAVALLVYLLNRGKYHPLVRAAIVTSALGYTLGGLSVLIDIGRAWNFYKIPLFFTNWNFNSILLEVALCIMLYTGVLWIELSPAFLERWRRSGRLGLRRFAVAATPKIEKAMPYVIAVGLLLPTMHQSSLGSLMLLSGEKLHVLWRTPMLPLLFLVSVLGMGYAAVTLEATISSKVFRRPSETPMLRALAVPISLVLLLYAALRTGDIIYRDQLIAVLRMDGYSMLFLLEMSLMVLPALALLVWRRRAEAVFLATMGVFVILGGALYRFSTYLIAFNPGPQWSYFPSLGEFAVTIGLIAGEILGYIVLVKRFPILRGAPGKPSAAADGAVPVAGHGPGGVQVPAAAPAMVLLALLLGTAVSVQAQQTRPRGEDLRCLTPNPEHCLPEPMPIDEPHEAVCATCHNLATQRTFAEAAKTCTAAGCHGDVRPLTPFHRGVRASVLQNCISCHPPHDARIRTGGDDCAFCHSTGGVVPGETVFPRRDVGRPVAANVVFRHARHTQVECRSCHSSEQRHGATTVRSLQECRSCHHRAPVAVNCVSCHTVDELRDVSGTVRRTFNMRIGTQDRPVRLLSFEHAAHVKSECSTCHTGGLAMTPTQAGCQSCHEEHHRPTANCTACHSRPPEGVHTRQAHFGCAGAGCHEAVAASIAEAPRTRSLCLACHTEMDVNHYPGNCSGCHQLPEPRRARR
jgi:Ni/Fe-hydrogenase subunit HybB-like protein/Fe-S-cluster-containing dehydrogenase component